MSQNASSHTEHKAVQAIRRPGTFSCLTFAMLCLWPPIASWFEASMVAHMLIQFPLLAIAGACLLQRDTFLSRLLDQIDPIGVTSLVLGTGAMLFWMIPLHLDLAILDPMFRVLKVTTVPLGVGLCLYQALRKSSLLIKLVIGFEAWAAVTRLGWIYLESPDQLCSSYLLGEQQTAGTILLVVSAICAAAALIRGLFGTFTAQAGQSVRESAIERN